MALLGSGLSIIDCFSRHDLDAESRKADIGKLRRGEQADRCDAQILENLGAQADLTPLSRARHFGPGRARLRDGMCRHTCRAVAQEDDHAATLLLQALQGGLDRTRAAEATAVEDGGMQPPEYILTVA